MDLEAAKDDIRLQVKATNCDKFIAAFCRFLSLGFEPRFFRTISLGGGVWVQTRVSTAFASSPFVARPERMATARRGLFAVVVWPWTVRGLFPVNVARRLAKRLALWLPPASLRGRLKSSVACLIGKDKLFLRCYPLKDFIFVNFKRL